MTGLGIALAERGLLPLPVLRQGIRGLLRDRILEIEDSPPLASFVDALKGEPVAVDTDAANDQHYEVPAELFELALGPHLKYSGAYWSEGVDGLAEAEERMLRLTVERAELEDGQEILELGCGWGSLTLYMAHALPESRITAVSNSASQRRHIEARAPGNVRVVTADIRDFEPEDTFQRVLSVEMFEHMRNLPELLRRISTWLAPGGKLFTHVFCHRTHPYLFETDGADDWMGRYFFTGGMMPSFDLLPVLDEHLQVEERWAVDGTHYARTARAWRENLEARRPAVMPVLERTYGPDARRWYHRWRLFFLACEELFGYRNGTEWLVGHYRLVRSDQDQEAEAPEHEHATQGA